MKLRRILSGFLAGAIAVTSICVTSITASAVSDMDIPLTATFTGWDPAATFDNGTGVVDFSAGANAGCGAWLNDTIDCSDYNAVVFTFSANTAGAFTAGVQYYAGGQSVELSENAASGTIVVPLTDGKKSAIRQIIFQGSNGSAKIESLKATNIELSTDDTWIENADGTVTYTSTDENKMKNYTFSVPDSNLADVAAISLDYKVENGSASCGLGTKNAAAEWTQKEDITNGTVIMPIDGMSYASFDLMMWYISAGTVITASNPEVLFNHDITNADAANGTVTVSKTKAYKGVEITVTPTPAEGYEIDEITVAKADGTGAVDLTEGTGEYTFAMPDYAVTVKVTFKETVPDEYDITKDDATNGSFTVDKTKAAKDATVTVTPTAAEGYVVDKVTVTKTDDTTEVEVTKASDKYTFTMPAYAVTVKVTFKEKPTTKYAITTSSAENGAYAVKVDGKGVSEATEGDEVSVVLAPADGYTLDKIDVKAGTEDIELTREDMNTFTFTMPAAAVTVTVTFAEGSNENPFLQDTLNAATGKANTVEIKNTTEGKRSEASVILLSKSDIAKASGVEVTITAVNSVDGKKKVGKVTVDTAYSALNFKGAPVEYSADKAVVSVEVTDIPDDAANKWTITYSAKPILIEE